MKVFIIIVILVVGVLVFGCMDEMQKDACTQFATEKGCTIVRYDTHMTIIGTPFYYINENTIISEFELDNGEIWFMRPSIFGNDWQQNGKKL